MDGVSPDDANSSGMLVQWSDFKAGLHHVSSLILRLLYTYLDGHGLYHYLSNAGYNHKLIQGSDLI